MQNSRSIVETVMGVVVLLLCVVFIVIIYRNNTTQKVDSSKYIDIVAMFDRADGVNIGSDVSVAGIKIGKVISADIDKKTYNAILVLRIRNDIPLPIDTSAEIITAGLLGEKYITLTPGIESITFKNGDKIEFTQSSISVEGVIGKFMTRGNAAGNDNGNDSSTNDVNEEDDISSSGSSENGNISDNNNDNVREIKDNATHNSYWRSNNDVSIKQHHNDNNTKDFGNINKDDSADDKVEIVNVPIDDDIKDETKDEAKKKDEVRKNIKNDTKNTKKS